MNEREREHGEFIGTEEEIRARHAAGEAGMSERYGARGTEEGRELGRKSPEELEAEIQRIREELDSTLTAIERKFSPTQMVDRTLHYLTGAPTDYAANLSHAIKANPIPAALMGISMGWLMMSGEERRSYPSGRSTMKETSEEMRSRAAGTAGRVKEKMSEFSHSVSETVHRAGDKIHALGEKTHKAREGMEEMGHRYGEKMEETGHRYGEKVHQGRERLEEAGYRAGEKMRQARGGFSEALNEQPLLLGILGVAAGALMAAMIPPTRQEEEWLGEAGSRLKEKVEETGREQMEKGRKIAGAAAEGAKEETERQLH